MLSLRVFLPVAQLDNAADSDSEERGFKSLQAGQTKKSLRKSMRLFRLYYSFFNIHFSLFITERLFKMNTE